MFGKEAIDKVLSEYIFDTVLDIGSGEGLQADYFEKFGRQVTRVDFGNSEYFDRNKKQTIIKGDYLDMEFENQFDLIWACHVLEHQVNTNIFMKKLKSDLKPDGILCVTVPPPKHEIVGGHVSVWNAGLLMYRLVLAGFNCSNARIKKYGYNISLILPNSPSTLDSGLPDLHYDTGDIDKLKNFFPLNTKEGFNGDITELNW